MESRTITIEKYYTCEQRMEKLYDKYARQQPAQTKNKDDYIQWKNSMRPVLKTLLGLDKMECCPLECKLLEKVEVENGIIREKIIIQTEPEVFMPVYILIPPKNDNQKKQRCFLAPPGHQGGGKYSVAGCYDIPAVADMIKFYNYDYGMQLAQQGCVAICPDCRGFGERREEPLQSNEEGKFLNSTCFHLAHMAEPLGLTVTGLLIWDLMRLIDYIEERNEWDTAHIGCLGFSGGGMQTLWLAALDDRIAYAAISGYMYGYKDSLLQLSGNCNCNYIPHLWEYVDMGDIGALIAPRPLMIQSCREDHLNGKRGIVNAIEQVEIIKSAYKCFLAETNVYHDICEGGHKWHPEHLDNFLNMCK